MPTTPEITPLSVPRREETGFLLDRSTAEMLAARTNDPAVRVVARAWLKAYRAARRDGLDAGAARLRAAAAWDQCCANMRNADGEASRGC